MATRVKVLGRVARQVGIVLKNGKSTSVRIMPRNKGVFLPDGATVDPRWQAANPDAKLQVKEIDPVKPAKPDIKPEVPKVEVKEVPKPETTAPTVPAKEGA